MKRRDMECSSKGLRAGKRNDIIGQICPIGPILKFAIRCIICQTHHEEKDHAFPET